MKKLLTKEQQELLEDGRHLLDYIQNQPVDNFSDYSFLVALFAKAYEGFLKSFFLKLKIITMREYNSDHFRVGKVLNPALRHKNYSVYKKLEDKGDKGKQLAKLLWQAWKQGRNLIFHYFPHNLHRLNFVEAQDRIDKITSAIDQAQKMI